MRKFKRGIQKDRQRNIELLVANRKEWLLIATSFLAVLLLNISAVNHSIGLFLLGYLCIFSLSSPFSALLALSASQTVADPVGIPLTLAQCLFVGWGFHFVIRPRKVDYKTVGKFLLWTVPYIVVSKLLNVVKWNADFGIDNFDLAFFIGLMAAWYVGQLRGRYLLGFLCIIAGASTSTLSFWIGVAGVAMEGITESKGANQIAGIGVGRNDGNYSGISVALAAISFLAWGLLAKIRIHGFRILNRIKTSVCICFFLISIPAVFATMSRGAVFTFFGALGFVVLSALYLNNEARRGIFVLGVAACIFGIMSFNSSDGLTRKYSGSMLAYSENQIEDSVMMSRTGTWGGAFQEILNSPLIGTTPGTQVAVIPYGYDYASHNVWLDVGRGTGILGMLWFTGFFFYPVLRLFRSLSNAQALLLCSSFVVLFFVFSNLSVLNLKIFYLLWVLAVAAADAGSDTRQTA